MKTLKSILILAVITLFLNSCKNETQPEVKLVETEQATNKSAMSSDIAYAKAEFTIEGMTCEIGCAKTIEKKLAKMEGVKSAKVDYDKKLAMVEFDDDILTTTSLEETVKKTSEIYSVKDMKTVETFEAKADDTKSCAEDCKKECCTTKL